MNRRKNTEIKDLLENYQENERYVPRSGARSGSRLEDMFSGISLSRGDAEDNNMFLSACMTDNVRSVEREWKNVSLETKRKGFTTACKRRSVKVITYYLSLKDGNVINLSQGIRSALESDQANSVIVMFPYKGVFKHFQEIFLSACKDGSKKILSCAFEAIREVDDTDDQFEELYRKGFKIACENSEMNTIEAFCDDRMEKERFELDVKAEVVFAIERDNNEFAEFLIRSFGLPPIKEGSYRTRPSRMSNPETKAFRRPTKALRDRMADAPSPIRTSSLRYPGRIERETGLRSSRLDRRSRSHSKSPERSRTKEKSFGFY